MKNKKVDDVEFLDTVIEKGAKGAIEDLKKITEELKSKDITNDKKLSLLKKQNICLKALEKYFGNN